MMKREAVISKFLFPPKVEVASFLNVNKYVKSSQVKRKIPEG